MEPLRAFLEAWRNLGFCYGFGSVVTPFSTWGDMCGVLGDVVLLADSLFFFIISLPSLEIHTSHWKFPSYLLICQILSLFVWFLVVFILFYQISISSLDIHNCVLLFFQIWSSFFWFYFLNCILFSIWFFFSIFSFNSKF